LRPVCVAGLWLILGTSAFGQAKIELVGPIETIPDVPYKTWSLFLVCTPDWVTAERSADLAHLYRRFQSFGDAIGSENLAVWFWSRRTALDDPQLSQSVDVARSAEYCRAIQLAPSDGPYLVVTSAYPSLPDFPAERAVFVLGALQPAELAKLLNVLTDQLLLQGRVTTAVVASSAGTGTAPVTFWVNLLEAAQRSIVSFGCRLKLQISTGMLNAELRACAP
jgi:hypothetical protein